MKGLTVLERQNCKTPTAHFKNFRLDPLKEKLWLQWKVKANFSAIKDQVGIFNYQWIIREKKLE
jgi:hypothetical protein